MSRALERYRRQTDDGQTDGRTFEYSEREREFTFAKNYSEEMRQAKMCMGIVWAW